MISSGPVVSLCFHHPGFVHVVQIPYNVWVWGGGCSGVIVVVVVDLRHLYFDVQVDDLNCPKWDFIPLFIDFNSNILSNSLQLPLLYVATPFLQSIDHVHLHNPSNA